MATLLPRRDIPDLTIQGNRIETVEATAEYGWILPQGDIVWENAQNTGFGFHPPQGATQVRRIRHIITERVEILDGPNKGTRLDV